MKETELRKYANCGLCGRPFGHTGLPLFWRLTVERFGVKMGVVLRQDGLAALLGGHSGLALVMGPDEEMAEPVMDAVTLAVCEDCMVGHVGMVMQAAFDRELVTDK